MQKIKKQEEMPYGIFSCFGSTQLDFLRWSSGKYLEFVKSKFEQLPVEELVCIINTI